MVVLGKSRKWAIWSGAPFSVIFDFPLDSFGIHAFYHSISRVVYMGWVRDVGGVDSRSRRDLEVHVGSGRINGGVVFRISVGMGRDSGDYG